MRACRRPWMNDRMDEGMFKSWMMLLCCNDSGWIRWDRQQEARRGECNTRRGRARIAARSSEWMSLEMGRGVKRYNYCDRAETQDSRRADKLQESRGERLSGDGAPGGEETEARREGVTGGRRTSDESREEEGNLFWRLALCVLGLGCRRTGLAKATERRMEVRRGVSQVADVSPGCARESKNKVGCQAVVVGHAPEFEHVSGSDRSEVSWVWAPRAPRMGQERRRRLDAGAASLGMLSSASLCNSRRALSDCECTRQCLILRRGVIACKRPRSVVAGGWWQDARAQRLSPMLARAAWQGSSLCASSGLPLQPPLVPDLCGSPLQNPKGWRPPAHGDQNGGCLDG